MFRGRGLLLARAQTVGFAGVLLSIFDQMGSIGIEIMKHPPRGATARRARAARTNLMASSACVVWFERVLKRHSAGAGAAPAMGIDCGTRGENTRAMAGMMSRLQKGDSNMPPTMTQASGC